MEGRLKIIGIGELLWDMLPSGKQLGGAPCNFAYHSKQLGADAFVVSSVGDDGPGREIISVLESLGLATDYLQVSDKQTGVVDVLLDSQGCPSYDIKEGVAWDNIGWSEDLIALARDADAVCFGSLAQRSGVSRNTIMKFLGYTSEDCLRVFDINLRQSYFTRGVILDSLRFSTVLKLNDDELPVLAEMLGYTQVSVEESVARLMEDFDLRLVALTEGGKGSVLFTPQGKSELSITKVDAADTVGAGDSFTAMMIYGLLKGVGLGVLHKAASALATYVCTQKGATPIVPDDILKFKN